MACTAAAKLVLIGIDAADIQLIRCSPGQLPCLGQVLAAGPVFRIASSPELTSSVWPTFSTGKPPGEHGVYYPLQWDPAAMTLRRLSPDWLGYEPFWYDLARAGKDVIALDVPFSNPSRLERGLEILNWGSQECIGPFSSNAPRIAREIRRRFGRHPAGADVPIEEPEPVLRSLASKLAAGARRKGELARWLLHTRPWDLFITVFSESHRAGHTLWPDLWRTRVPEGALLSVYQAIDHAVGHILDGIDRDNTTVVVFSIHGMGPNHTQEHFLPGMMERINAAFTGGSRPALHAAPPPAFNPVRLLRAAVPPRLQATVASALPGAARDWVVRRSFLGGLDWNGTPAFALPGSGEGYIRFNLAGREKCGILDPHGERYRVYKAFLNDGLLSFKDAATNYPVVKEVVFLDERYSGRRAGLLPDAVVIWNDLPPACEIRSPRFGRLNGSLATGRTGEHRPDGFAALAGNLRALERAPRLEDAAGFAPFVRSLMLGDNFARASRTAV